MVIPLNATQRVRLLIDTSYLPDGVGSRAHLATGPHRQSTATVRSFLSTCQSGCGQPYDMSFVGFRT